MAKATDALKSWGAFLGNPTENVTEASQKTPQAFMEEFQRLKMRFSETRSTADFKELNLLYEKFDISREDFMKYSRVYTMLNNNPKEDAIILGEVPAKELDELLQKGDYAGAVSRIKAGLSEDQLKELVNYPQDQRNFHDYHLTQFLPQLVKSENFKSSDYLLITFQMSKEGDKYIIRENKDKFQKDMKNDAILGNYTDALQKLYRDYTDTLLEDIPLPGLDIQKSEVNRQSPGIRR